MNDPLRPEDAKEKPAKEEIRDQSLLDTGPADQAQEDAGREMPTIMPSASELPDSHEDATLGGPDAVIDFIACQQSNV